MKWLAHICSGLSNFSKTFEHDFSTLLIIRNCLDPIERQRAKTFLLKAEKDKKKINKNIPFFCLATHNFYNILFFFL